MDDFLIAFKRDVNFHDHYPMNTYLDFESGFIMYIYKNDIDAFNDAGISMKSNESDRIRIDKNPDRYLLIPGLSHGEHHSLLKKYLDSTITDEEEGSEVATKYIGSIGAWKEAVGEDEFNNYVSFRDREIKIFAKQFIEDHGFEVEWV